MKRTFVIGIRAMESKVITELAKLATRGEPQLAEKVLDTILASSGEALTVTKARDTLSKVLNRVRGGSVQVVGRNAETMAVVMSVRDLAELVASLRPSSFGSALDEIGFKPLGRRIKIQTGVDYAELKTSGRGSDQRQ